MPGRENTVSTMTVPESNCPNCSPATVARQQQELAAHVPAEHLAAP